MWLQDRMIGMVCLLSVMMFFVLVEAYEIEARHNLAHYLMGL